MLPTLSITNIGSILKLVKVAVCRPHLFHFMLESLESLLVKFIQKQHGLEIEPSRDPDTLFPFSKCKMQNLSYSSQLQHLLKDTFLEQSFIQGIIDTPGFKGWDGWIKVKRVSGKGKG